MQRGSMTDREAYPTAWITYLCYGALRWGHPLSAAAGSGSTGISTARAAEGHGR